MAATGRGGGHGGPALLEACTAALLRLDRLDDAGGSSELQEHSPAYLAVQAAIA